MYGWERYKSIEHDFLIAREFVSFDIKEAYSDFFSKEVILLGAEIEGCFKKICADLTNESVGNVGEYKQCILREYPGIVSLRSRLLSTQVYFVPFHEWDKNRLPWWTVYTNVKHSITDHSATLNIALNMLAAYQLLLFIIHMQKGLQAGIDGSIETYLLSEAPRLFIPEIGLTQGFVGSDSLLHQMFPVQLLLEKLKSNETD